MKNPDPRQVSAARWLLLRLVAPGDDRAIILACAGMAVAAGPLRPTFELVALFCESAANDSTGDAKLRSAASRIQRMHDELRRQTPRAMNIVKAILFSMQPPNGNGSDGN